MRAFFQKNSNVKSNNPTPDQKQGKIFEIAAVGKQKYLNDSSKSHKYIRENFTAAHNQQVTNALGNEVNLTLRNIRRSFHIPEGTIYQIIPEVTAKYGTPLYKKQTDRYATELAKAFKEYNKVVKENAPKGMKKPPKVPYTEIAIPIYDDQWSWVTDLNEKALMHEVAAIEILEKFAAGQGGADRMYSCNVHYEKHIDNDSEEDLSTKVNHNGHLHLFFSNVASNGRTLAITQSNLALRKAASDVSRNFKYRFKLVIDKNGKPVRGKDGMFMKKHILDEKGNKISFVKQDSIDLMLEELVESAELNTGVSIDQMNTELMKAIEKHDVSSLKQLNLKLDSTPYNASVHTIIGKKGLEFKTLHITHDNDKQIKIPHQAFDKVLKNRLEKIGKMETFERKNNISVDSFRYSFKLAQDSLTAKPSYKDLVVALEAQNLKLTPIISTDKNGQKEVTRGNLELLDSGHKIPFSWLGIDTTWLSLQQLLALEEEEFIKEIELQKAIDKHSENSFKASTHGYITGTSQELKSIEHRLGYFIEMQGNSAVRNDKSKAEVFTVHDDNSLKTAQCSQNVTDLMLAKFVLLNKDKVNSGEKVSVEINTGFHNKDADKFCRHAYISSQLLEVEANMTFDNNWKPESDPTISIEIAEAKQKFIDKKLKSKIKQYSKVVRDNPNPLDRIAHLDEHWNIESLKYQCLAAAVEKGIYKFHGYDRKDIIADKNKILQSISSDKHDSLNKFFDAIEKETNRSTSIIDTKSFLNKKKSDNKTRLKI